MRKLTLTFLLLFITFTGILSCRENESVSDSNFNDVNKSNMVISARFSNLTEEELVSKLIVDEDFINYGGNLFRFLETMPKKNDFINNFDVKVWEKDGVAYLGDLSGYTELEIENKLYTIASDLKVIQDKYPQLIYNGENEQFINNVINTASNQLNDSGVWGKYSCAECRRIHRPRVIMGTIVGGITGFLSGGVTGAGAGAVSSMLHALDNAGTCFEAAGCL